MRYKQSQQKCCLLQRGFTLIELMITLVVLAVLLSIAAPSFTDMINNNRSVAVSENFIGALSYARSEAVKRAARVSICASTDGVKCSAANTWSQGWMVFVDTAGTDKSVNVGVGEILRTWEAGDNAAISVKQGTDTNFIRYTSLGTLGRFNETTIITKVTDCTGASARTLVISGSGVLNINKSSC
ncbi:GspH/FimT family pseudopilin [Microbulbifer variabilis]|uniref:GspH/FimT family pseudopilin n=1 Tax=Microbulbifer variabilis TaxID=266805 RepID=UPI001CFEF266|nr:GspH/FimT family pseudopilin [Microbulbifer variabilis]